MHEGEMSRLGKWGLIVPAKTAEPSSSINRVNALASASVANIFVSRVRLRCLGRTPRLRSNVTYQVGVIAPSSPVLQHSSLRRFGDDYLAAHEIENVAGHLTCVPAAAKGLVTHKIVLACVLDWRDLDDEVGWRVKTTRRLLADLVGGEAGRNMRDQFLDLAGSQRARRFTLAGHYKSREASASSDIAASAHVNQ